MQGIGGNANGDLQKQMEIIINKFKKINFKYTQEALDECSNETVRRLSGATNTKDGIGFFKSGWKSKKYPNAQYVYNDAGTGGIGKGIPYSNLAEYSSRGPQPFINSTWGKSKTEISKMFIKIMEKKLK